MTPERFAEIRNEAELTQFALAEFLGMKSGHVIVSHWERGVTPIRRTTAMAMELLALKGKDWVCQNIIKEA